MDEQAKHPLDVEDRVFADLGMIRIGRIAPTPQTHVQGEGHLALEAIDTAGQFAPRQAAGGAAVQALGQTRAPGGGGELGLQHIAVGTIAAGRGEGLGGRDRKPAALRIQQAVKKRRRIDRRHAPPVNAAIQR
nr:hypothetical protein [Brevundimonas vesicularis]